MCFHFRPILILLALCLTMPVAHAQVSPVLGTMAKRLDQLEAEERTVSGASARSSQRENIGGLRQELRMLDRRDFSSDDKIDLMLLMSRVNGLDFRYRVVRPWERDPGDVLDRIKRLPYRQLPFSTDDLARFSTELRQVPERLQKATEALTNPAAELTEIALFHVRHYDGVGQGEPLRVPPPAGILGWYRDLVRRLQEHHPSLVGAAERATRELEGFERHLEQLLRRTETQAGVGLEQYDWYLRHVRLLPYDARQVESLGQRELDRAVVFLKIEENRNRDLPELSPVQEKETYEQRVRDAETHIRKFIDRHQLLTIPEEFGPFETDAFWRAGMPLHFWEEVQYRDAHNNHVHASIPGHRFDGLLREKRNSSHPIRSKHRDGGRIEGWAFYLEEMLLQAGMLDRLPRARELFYVAQIARAVRIPVELKIQTGELDLEEAIQYMVQRTPLMEPNLARYDLEVYYRRPTYGMNYFMGRLQLEGLLAEVAARRGDAFDLGQFHDEFLSHGWLPIDVIRLLMLGWDERGDRLLEELTGG